MEGAWRKAKRALALRLCVHVPVEGDGAGATSERRPASSGAGSCRSEAAVTVATASPQDEPLARALRRSKSGSRSSSKRKCAICFDSMRSGHGQALFTAECSHKFHFHCISSNVKHGNHVCPVCRAKWKEIPLNRSLSLNIPQGRVGINRIQLPQQDAYVALLHQVPNRQRGVRRLHTSEPTDFNDDEPLQQTEAFDNLNIRSTKTAEISTYPEFSSIPQSSSQNEFSVLIHLKAPSASSDQATGRLVNESSVRSPSSRAPVDLVTVIDVSGSMAGTKLALLKRAMGFVVQHLGPSDRLSVIAFSSAARRLFHLQRMSHHGRQQALQAINSLGAGGGTNIADALKKATKVIDDRSYMNSVCSIILLSDGQDTYSVPSNVQGGSADYRSLVPPSILNDRRRMLPIHAFGFGADHDSDSMHSIAEASGGTFSFIEDEGVMQDAFAQCIGGPPTSPPSPRLSTMDGLWDAWPESDGEEQQEEAPAQQPPQGLAAPEQPPVQAELAPDQEAAQAARQAARRWRRERRLQPIWPEQHAAMYSIETTQNEGAYRQVLGGLEQAAAAAEAAAVRASLETHRREEAEREVRRQLAENAASAEQQAIIAQYEADLRQVALRSERRTRQPSEQAQLHRLRVQGRAERHRLAAAHDDGEAGPSNHLAAPKEDDDA